MIVGGSLTVKDFKDLGTQTVVVDRPAGSRRDRAWSNREPRRAGIGHTGAPGLGTRPTVPAPRPSGAVLVADATDQPGKALLSVAPSAFVLLRDLDLVVVTA